MGKHNARRRRRRAESAVSARGASSREGYSASGTLKVSLPQARHSAPPRCSALRITVAFSSFACLRPTKDSWRGRHMANRRSINSETLPKWVYSLRSVIRVTNPPPVSSLRGSNLESSALLRFIVCIFTHRGVYPLPLHLQP